MLYEHQKSAIRKLIENPRFALYHEQGLGKTISAIVATDYILKNAQKNRTATIVCPAFLQSNWHREIEKWSKFPDCYNVYSYERFVKIPASFTLARILIVDESHYIKSHRAERTKQIVRVARQSSRVILLTGTPIGNNGIIDLYSHLVCLNPEHKYAYFRNFRDHFIKPKTIKFMKAKTQNENEFLKIVDDYSERKLKEECLDLPDKIYHQFECKGTPVHQNMHVLHKMQAQEGFDFDIKDPESGETVETVYSKSQKIQVLLELLETILQSGKQVVIYVSFRKSLDFIAKNILLKLERKYLEFHGGLTSKEKEDILDKFKNNKCKLLIATMQSMNVGVTLTNCNEVIYYSRTFSCTERVQSEDRFHRIGQKNIVNYYDIVAKGVDKRAFEMIKQNKSYDEIKKEIKGAE